ncbi:MAG: hypothetical protein HY391_01660 [Deltaproteobacteria bacterium]|nr:hypothetical protein [Deltaproteobacteria bacterium]
MNEYTVSCRVTNALLSYLDQQDRFAISPLLSDMAYSEEYLRDTTNWIEPHAVAILFHRLEKRLGDPRLPEKIGMSAPLLSCWGSLDGVLRLIANPQLLFEQGAEFSRYFFRKSEVSVLECREGMAILRFTPNTLMPHEKLFLVGVFAGLPQYWAEGTADYSSLDEECYRFAWQEELSLFDLEEGLFHTPLIRRTLLQLDAQNQRLAEKHSTLWKHYQALQSMRVPFDQLEEKLRGLQRDEKCEKRSGKIEECLAVISELKELAAVHLSGIFSGREESGQVSFEEWTKEKPIDKQQC